MRKRNIAVMLLTGTLILGNVLPAAAAQTEGASEKSETVSVKSNADGSVQEITVSDWLKVSGESDEIEDISTLADIKNTEGDEEFRQKADGTLFWENHGEDISYEGKSEEELPVTVKVSYYLNGVEKSPEEMAGVSGEVKIRFDFENHTSETVSVDGKDVEVQVPFTVVSALMLPSDIFSNVEVTNGKVVEDKDQSIVAGLAFPGLKDSLKLAEYEPTEDIEIPDYIEVTADADGFELELTATVVTAGGLADIDTEDIEDVDDLTDSMGELTDASAQLADGAGELISGMRTFQSYMNTYTEGVSAVSEGANALAEGLTVLNTQKSNLEQGAKQLESGLTSLNGVLSQISVPADLNEAVAAVKALCTDAETIADNLDKIQGSFTEASDELGKIDLDAVETNATSIARSQAKTALEETLSQMVTNEEITEDQKREILSEIGGFENIDVSGAAGDAGEEIAAVQKKLNAYAEAAGDGLSDNLDTIKKTLEDMQRQLDIVKNYAGDIQDISGSAEALQKALGELTDGVGQLKTGSQQLVQGISAYGEGIEKSSEGAKALSGGATELSIAGNQLNVGFGALLEGGNALETGLKTFDQEGIQKLSDLAGEDLENVIVRFKALKEADSRYNNFSGITEGTSGDVKFIIETEEIK